MWINRAGSAEKAGRRRENAHKLSTILCKRNSCLYSNIFSCAQEAALGISAGSISRSSALYSLHCRRKMVVRRSGLRAVESGLFVLVWQNPLYVRLVPCGVRLALPSLFPEKGGKKQPDGLKTRPAGGSDGMKTSPEPSFLLAGGRQPDFSGAFIRMRPEAPSFL